MNPAFNNPNWEFIINSISIGLGIFALLLSVKISFEKEIGLIDLSYTKKIEEIADCENRTMHRIVLLLKNFGREVIYDEDLLGKIKVQLNDVESVKMVTVESTCKYNSITKIIGVHDILLTPDFWEGSKLIRIQIEYYSDVEANCKVIGKVIGGNDIDEIINIRSSYDHNYFVGKKQTDVYMFKLPAVVVGSFFLLILVFEKMFNLNHDKVIKAVLAFNKDSVNVVSIILVVLLICLGVAIKFLKISLPFAVLAKKEKEWFAK